MRGGDVSEDEDEDVQEDEQEDTHRPAAILWSRTHAHEEFALVLGSGLGPFADTFEERFTIDYEDIPHFPVSSVEGHAGRLVFGHIADVPCVTMQGRVHYYEGYPLETVTFPLRTMISLGARTVILTNAAGSTNEDYPPGHWMSLKEAA